MICSSSSPPIRRRPGEGRGPRGFTLVELLAVILILAVLIALLLPALNGALRTAKNAAVGGEINQLAQALASFKAKYGDYPPSRIYLAENGDYTVVDQQRRPQHRGTSATSPGATGAAVGRGPPQVLSQGGPEHLGRCRVRGRTLLAGTTSTATACFGRRPTSSRATSAWSSSWAAFRCRPAVGLLA